MIEYLTKDVTTVENGLILHGCNCSAAFGSGVAGAIRRKWPKVYKEFIHNGSGKGLLGTVHFIPILNHDDGHRPEIVVCNGYTQEFYGSDGKRYADLEAVSKCLFDALLYCDGMIYDLYMPKIGCGLGGLLWEDEVKPLIEKASFNFPGVNIFVCDI